MESSLRKILTPTSSLDLLREIDAVTSPSSLSLQKPRPYVISVVGVNGVGKSTNLSKICFFLLQNKYKVLVVACDTFRSGAVEQLAVHVRNLKELTAREGGTVELYQKGYGKDAANVAKDAVTHAKQEGFDVVLIDTAGRRHNDQRLMSSLEKFANFANPDKILMVGEVSKENSIKSLTDISRLWWERILLLKHEISTQPSELIDALMALSSLSVTPLETWLVLWLAWSMLRMFQYSSSVLDNTTVT
jgi:signal recognition particle GTPase